MCRSSAASSPKMCTPSNSSVSRWKRSFSRPSVWPERVRVVPDLHLARRELRILEIGPGSFIVEMKQPLQIHRARSTKNQGFIEFKCGDQMIHGQNTNLVLGQCGKQFVVPTLVLLPDEKLHRRRDPFQLLGWS